MIAGLIISILIAIIVIIYISNFNYKIEKAKKLFIKNNDDGFEYLDVLLNNEKYGENKLARIYSVRAELFLSINKYKEAADDFIQSNYLYERYLIEIPQNFTEREQKVSGFNNISINIRYCIQDNNEGIRKCKEFL